MFAIKKKSFCRLEISLYLLYKIKIIGNNILAIVYLGHHAECKHVNSKFLYLCGFDGPFQNDSIKVQKDEKQKIR